MLPLKILWDALDILKECNWDSENSTKVLNDANKDSERFPEFIKIAQNAGFAATKHKTEFQSLLALPFFLSSMLIIAAPFSVRFIRSESVNNLILAGVISGLILYTFSNVIYAFGASGNIGPILSAWSPPILAILLGISAIIYIEEG